ncbi:MAG: hypothetical protein CVU48_08970 [Candidatus Cloacimonetes bacterium HGW-Cloacimonetes-1]|nr:MAG: hypothetical protein CVU48_08970 [Candidatus Cloacimonetes bacterium HGW-Cloacimonetes-1]
MNPIEIRIFLSCPSGDTLLGDLHLDLEKKSKELNKYYEPQGFRFEVLHWEQPWFVCSEKGKTPQELIMEKVGNYDFYFGMMGCRYGSLLDGCSVSPTEFEFNDALERNSKASLHKYPRSVCFSFLMPPNKDSLNTRFSKAISMLTRKLLKRLFSFGRDNQIQQVTMFRQRAWKTGISHEYQNKSEIVTLFESKLNECIDTAYVKYPLPDEYKISLSVTDRKSSKDAFFRSNQSSLYEKISEGKRILLLGSGGSGKSTYLEYTAYLFSNKIDSFTPIHIKLKLYNAETLYEIIISETRFLPKNPLLLLDGYDELSDELKLQFPKQLIKWMKRYADAPIVVTSRPIDPSTSPLREFDLYDMSILGNDQIKEYLRLNHIDDSIFTNSNLWNELYSLSQIPFYLVKIAEFYIMEGSLPTSMSQILEFAIKHGANSDKEHFETSFTADYEYHEMDDSLSLLSFCMTNSGKTSVLRKELESIIPDSKIADFLRKHTRLIESESNQQGLVYSFSHKIFQDYLAAKAICQISYSSIMDIISDTNKEWTCYNWEPSIPFLIELLQSDEGDALVEHIFSKQPSLLIEVKPDLLCDDMKQRLFTSTFEYYADKTQYIPSSVSNRKLAAIWDSSSMEMYLLDFIGNVRNPNSMLIEAFVLLKYSKQVNKELIDKALLACLQNDKLAGYRSRLNHVAAHYIKINDFDQAILDELFEKNPRDTIQLLAVYDKSFKHIDELIELYKEIDKKNKRDQSDSNTKLSIEDYLVYCVKSNHLHEVITSTISSKLLLETSCLDDEMKEIVEYACENYKFEEVYEDMYNLFVHCIETPSDRHLAEIYVYFIRQKVEYQVVKRVFDEGKDSYHGVRLVLLNPDSIEFVSSICKDLIPTLSQQKQKVLYKYLANPQIPPLYKDILETQNINLEQYRVESFEYKKKRRLMHDMELVLNVELIINELDLLYGEKDSITVEEFRSLELYQICTFIDRVIRDYRAIYPSQRTIPKKVIEKALQEKHQDLIIDFIESNFKKQSRISAFNDDKNIELSHELQLWLDNWKNEVLQNTDITKERIQTSSVGSEIDNIQSLWSFVKEDLVVVNDSVLLDFLSFVGDTSEDWSVIEAKISNKPMIKSRVAANLNDKHLLTWNPLANHIWFCTNNHYYEVLPHSYDILKRLDDDFCKDEHLRFCCLESIISIESDQFRFESYVLDCPSEILDYFARGFVKEKRSMIGLITRLKEEVTSNESGSTQKYPYYLVCLGETESLPKYIEVVKQTLDFYIDHEYPNPFEDISDVSQLDLLIDLLVFSFENEIKQARYHSLTRCILSSVENIAYQSHENYENILGLLTDLTNKYPEHQDTYILFECIWKLEDEMPKRTTKLPTLLESLDLYNRINGS